jgi:hypothetical protein
MEYYDRQGDIIDQDRFLELFGNRKYQVLKQTNLPDGTHVSTVWLGFAHGFGPNGPMIFETLIRRDKEGEEEMYRYSTEEEALKHHHELIGVEYHANTYGTETRWYDMGDDLE